jgi:hypothetical protein
MLQEWIFFVLILLHIGENICLLLYSVYFFFCFLFSLLISSDVMIFKNLIVAASSVMLAVSYARADEMEGFEGEDSLYGDEDMEGYGGGE